MNIVGYFHGIDPAACLVKDGELVAFCEEERLIRYKHAPNMFPTRSIEHCLKSAGLALRDVDAFAYGWDAPAYTDGRMAKFYEQANAANAPDAGTLGWQKRNLSWFREEVLTTRLRTALYKHFGDGHEAKLLFEPHHRSHAATAFFFSPHEEALVLVVDGSGDNHCATVWRGRGTELELLHSVDIPHSLGWFYAAMTEYLGFDAYDGEYKVMGLAAYGRPNERFKKALGELVRPGPLGFDYVVDPKYIHHGKHTFSERFTDSLVELVGMPPRMGPKPLTKEHEDLAYETQMALEEHALRLLRHFAEKTGIKKLCVSGGVALNVKLNSRIHREGMFDDIFIFPIPSDSGSGLGAAIAHSVRATGKRPAPLRHVYLGPRYEDAELELQLSSCGLAYEKHEDIAEPVADLLTEGKIVAWVQGGLEGGPRALGARSILADPRDIKARDRVNGAIKFREYWRPFCPSMTEESAPKYLQKSSPAPFMIIAFDATEAAKKDAPAIVHVDGTVRVQTVSADTNPPYHRLLKAFERRTGVPILLNTSLNIKGEAMVCSPRDALRTFFSTGIDALAIGSFLVKKPATPVEIKPEEVLR
jgi:carbamoyltransferase